MLGLGVLRGWRGPTRKNLGSPLIAEMIVFMRWIDLGMHACGDGGAVVELGGVAGIAHG